MKDRRNAFIGFELIGNVAVKYRSQSIYEEEGLSVPQLWNVIWKMKQYLWRDCYFSH